MRKISDKFLEGKSWAIPIERKYAYIDDFSIVVGKVFLAQPPPQASRLCTALPLMFFFHCISEKNRGKLATHGFTVGEMRVGVLPVSE